MNANQASLEDFLDLFPILSHRGWEIKKGRIIRDKDGFCPLCALANEIDPNFTIKVMVLEAMHQVLGDLDLLVHHAIISAADGFAVSLLSQDELFQALTA